LIDTTFKIWSLDRERIHWEDHILDLSPVQEVDGVCFKREDFFAPLGYGNINGSKLRQCIWLIDKFVKSHPKPVGVVQGAVTGSPQHPMVATICKHYGLKSIHTVGSPDIEKYKNLKLALDMGATFEVCNVGYAKTLEAKARAIADQKKGYFFLETNITVDHEKNPADRVEAFHAVGAEQARNIPDHIDTIILPAGSCNSATSVLYGIAKYRPKNLKRIVLFGIGNYGSKDPDYIRRRLNVIGHVAGIDFDQIYEYPWGSDGLPFTFEDTSRIIIQHHDLNGSGYCEYNDLMPYTHASIAMHPRYEGKIWNYMRDNTKVFKTLLNNKTMFWIVGSEPQ
jgi:hypothetical protein